MQQSAFATLPNPLYVGAGAAGSGDGSTAGNRMAENPNLYGSWSTLGIGANWNVILVGQLGQFSIGGTDGAVANGVTISMPGSGISIPGTSVNPFCLDIPGAATDLTIDGTGGGYLTCTANGSALANQTAIWAIRCVGSVTRLSVKNLAITNIYVHTSVSDDEPGADSAGGIYANELAGSNFFGGLIVSDCPTGLLHAGGAGSIDVISNCAFNRCDHAIYPGADSTIAENCSFGSAANWDTTDNIFHHNAIIYFPDPTKTLLLVRDNIFDGNMGVNNTAYLFNGSGFAEVMFFCNNFYRVWPGNHLNDGVFVGSGTHFNETYIDASGNPGGNTCFDMPGQFNVIENCIVAGFGAFIIETGTTTAGNIQSNNIWANPAGTPSWQFGGTNYSSYSSYAAHVGEANGQYIASSGTLVNTTTGVLLSGSAAIGAANTNGWNIGVTNDYFGNARLANGPVDVGAFDYFVPGLNFGITFTTP